MSGCAGRHPTSHNQPRHHSQHPAPSQQPNHGGDPRIVVQDSEAGEDCVEVVLDEIGIACCYQRQDLGACVRHIGRGVEPVLEEEEQAEGETGGLALAEKIDCQQERDEALQQRPSPETKRGTKPSEEIVSALMDDEVGAINEEEFAMRVESVEEKCHIKDQPRRQRRTRERLPRLIENCLQRPLVVMRYEI